VTAAIHQFVAGYATRDAISNEARTLRGVFKRWGYDSAIFSESRRILPELRGDTVDVSEARSRCGATDVALLHLSIGSPVNEVFASLPCRKAILYHNVTPPHYFERVNPNTANSLALGLRQVRSLAGAAEVNMADSDFNGSELAALGYRDVRTFPLALDFDSIGTPPDRATMDKFSDGRLNILFVGRGAPNKRLEDLLAALVCLQAGGEPHSRLILAGSFAGTETYYSFLLSEARSAAPDSVHIMGSVSQPVLSALYRSASVFLCMSEHEGFCIPIVESMVHNVPVLAYAAAAVPETMDGAGVLFRNKDFPSIAEMLLRLSRDPVLREAVINGQRERLARYRRRDLEAELRVHLAPLLAGAPRGEGAR
jgi:glycosyltransferase involved in cell wall biosynthesis